MSPDPKVVAKALGELAATVKQVMHVSNPRLGTLQQYGYFVKLLISRKINAIVDT